MSAGRQIRQASKQTIKKEQCGSNPPKGVPQANSHNTWALARQGGYSWPIAIWEQRYATQTTPTLPTRVVPPKIVVNHPYYRVMFDCETYALDNKSVVYTRRQARTLVRRKKEVALSFGVHDEWDGSPPAKVLQFFGEFAKACDDNDISEGEAFYIHQDTTKGTS